MMSRPLPKGWTWIPLGQYVENHDGRRVPISRSERESRQGAFPYYGASGVIDTIDGFTHDGEFVLIGEDGANLLTRSKPLAFLTRGKVWVNNHAHVLRCKPGFSNAYLAYYINSINLSAYVTGTAQPKLSQSMMNKIPIPVAPPEQQTEIVAEIEKQFSRLDEAVANLQRVKANLKRYKASVLKAAVEGRLVETEASIAQREGRSYETGEQLLQRILEERRAKWSGKGKYKEPIAPLIDELPQLPDGWTWATMPQLGELNRGKSKHRPRDDQALYGGPYPFIQTGDVRRSDGSINEFTQTYSEFGLAQSRLWPAGTLCITIAANIAETGILKLQACFPDSVVGFIPQKGTPTVEYVECFIRTARDRLDRFASATAQKNINLEVLEAVAIPTPPLAEQARIIAEVDRHFSIIREVEVEVDVNLQRSQALRQATLKNFLGGNIR
jgi:type I restriction enzyme S subunit